MLCADLLTPLVQESHVARHRGLGAIGKDLLPLLALRPTPLLHRLVSQECKRTIKGQVGIGGSTGCCASNHSSGHGFAQPCSTAQPGRAERQPQLWDGGQFVQEGTSGAAAHLLLTVRLLAAGTSHLSLLLFDGHQEVAMLSLACGVPADRERPSGRAVGPLRHPQQQPTQPVPKPHHRTTVLSSSAHITASPPAPSCGTTVPLIPQQDETHCPDTVTPGQLHPTATHPTTPQLEGREP